ncbi:MAG: hypothetical protein ABIG93_01105 [archaeon]|nr:hypothetical protein [Nanoarchaeota archaeon]
MANILTHTYMALQLTKDQEITQEELDHLIVGSILPDIHLTGLIQYHNTHHKSKDFFEYANGRLKKILALGIILHSENPKGLDHYFHGWNGFITQNSDNVKRIAKRYKSCLGKIDEDIIHHLIEFSVDSILTKHNPEIVPKLIKALNNPRMGYAITAFSSYHDLGEKKNKKINAILKKKHLMNFIKNFLNVENTANNWLSLRFYMNLKEGRALSFSKKLKRMTQFSFYNLKRTIDDRQMISLFKELNELLEDRTLKALTEAEKEIRVIKNEYWANLPD